MMTAMFIAANSGIGSGGGGGDTTPPTISSITAINSTTIRVIFSETVNVTTAGWSFKKNGVNLGISSVSGSGNTWNFTVASMASTDTITYSYSTSGATTDTSLNELAAATNQSVINTIPAAEHPFNLTTNNRVIRAGGTPGVNCDYENVDDAYAAITTNSISNQYTLLLMDGEHIIKGPEFVPGSPIRIGLVARPYIHLVGESKTGTIIKNVPAVGNEGIVSTIAYPNTNLIKTLTIQATNAKYGCHFDTNLYEYDQYVIDCNLQHFGGGGLGYEFGCGFHGGQKLHIIRCTTSNFGYYGHGNPANTRDLSKHFEIHIKDSNLKFEFMDHIEYSANTITLTDNTIPLVKLTASSANYDAHPGSPTDNQGFKVYTAITADGNLVTTLTRDAEAASILGTNFNDVGDFL